MTWKSLTSVPKEWHKLIHQTKIARRAVVLKENIATVSRYSFVWVLMRTQWIQMANNCMQFWEAKDNSCSSDVNSSQWKGNKANLGIEVKRLRKICTNKDVQLQHHERVPSESLKNTDKPRKINVSAWDQSTSVHTDRQANTSSKEDIEYPKVENPENYQEN